jgi:hypothetical protein
VNNIAISKKSLQIILTYIVLASIYRFLLPFGDEPDFPYRLNQILEKQHLFYSPYYYFQNILKSLNWNSDEYFLKNIFRLGVLIFSLSPLFLILLFKKQFINKMIFYDNKILYIEWSRRIDALSLTLLFPSILFYLGVLAEEHFILILSLYIFLFWNFKKIVMLLLLLMSLIDIGNFYVVLVFIFLVIYFKYINKFGSRIMIYNMFIFILIAYFLGLELINYISMIPIFEEKASFIYDQYTTTYAAISTKYPSFIRPFFTIMSGVFWLPSNFFVFYLYPFYFLILFYLNIKSLGLINKENISVDVKNNLRLFLSSMSFIFIAPLVANGFSVAKYYVFLIPFILIISLYFFRFRSIFYFLVVSNFLIFLQLLFIKF